MKKVWRGRKEYTKSGQHTEGTGRGYVRRIISLAGRWLLWESPSNQGIARNGHSKSGIPVPWLSHIEGRPGNR